MSLTNWLTSLKRTHSISTRRTRRRDAKVNTQSVVVESLEDRQLLSGINPVLDQENLGSRTFTQGIGRGRVGEPILSQSFTVGIEGTLDSVGFVIVRNSGGSGQVFADISEVDSAGRPVGSPLATVEIDRSQLPPNPGGTVTADELYRIDFSTFDIDVEVGDELAVVLRDDVNGTIAATSGGGDTYAGGVRSFDIGSGFQVQGGTDYFFQTYVRPTEVVLDQENLGAFTFTQGIGRGGIGEPILSQSFQVGVTGELNSVGFVITDNSPSTPGNVFADLSAVDASGLPVGSPLATVQIDRNQLLPNPGANVTAEDLYRIDFSSFDLSVEAGDELAIVLRDDTNGTLSATYGGVDSYADGIRSTNIGGGFVAQGSTDYFFQTFVEPAEVMVDQEHTGPFTFTQGIGRGGFGEPILAQSFTADLDGTLESVGFVITDNSPSTPGQVFADIRNVDSNNFPIGPALATVEIDRDQLLPIPGANVTADDFYQIDFSSFGISVSAGDRLAVVLRDNVNGTLSATYGGADGYAGGSRSVDIGGGFFAQNGDYFFNTSIRKNTAPDLEIVQNQQVRAGQQLNVTATATDAESTNLTYSLDQASLDIGMTIDANTGEINWTPMDGQAGVYQVEVTVHDNGTPDLCDMMSFQVTAIAETPSLVVTTDLDAVNDMDGVTSLREATMFADSDPDASEITFGDGGNRTGGTNFEDAVPDMITLDGGQLSIGSSVTLAGPGADLLTVSGDELSRVFRITGDDDVTIDSITMSDGATTGRGGAISHQGRGRLFVLNSLLSDNTAQLGGGAIQVGSGGATIRNSSLVENTAGGGGGAIRAIGAIDIINSTLSGNEADNGGAVSANNVDIVNSTVVYNEAQTNGGLSVGSGSISNSIVSGNTAAAGTQNVSRVLPGSNNLIDQDVSLIVDANLADNGGSTPTHAVLAGSPAINAGDNSLAVDETGSALQTDQRGAGFDRIQFATTDIGAVESAFSNAAPHSLALTSSNGDLANKSDDGSVTVTGSWTDVDVNDTHTVTIDWGDGTVETIDASSVNQVADEFSAGHEYADGGIYTIAVTVTDSAGEAISESTSAVVQGVGLVDGVLYVIGTDGKDLVSMLERQRGAQLRVISRFDGERNATRYFSTAGIDRIEMHLCDGNDTAKMSQQYWRFRRGTDIPASIDGGDGHDYIVGGGGSDTISGGTGNDWIDSGRGDDIVYAGDGNDIVTSGTGDDIVLGQAGNDKVFAGFGDDIVIGGHGKDVLFGSFGEDMLVTGSTNFDSDESQLTQMRDTWTGGGSVGDRQTAILNSGLEVTHDNDVDWAFGGFGQDWLLLDSDLDRGF